MAAKLQNNLNLKVLNNRYTSKSCLIKLQFQYCDQNSGSTSLPNLSFKTSTELLSTLSSISTSRIFELASSKVKVTSVKSTKQQWASQWKWQGYTMIGLGSDINEIVGNDTGIIAHWWTWDLEDPVKNADNVVKDLCSSNLHGHQSLFSNTYLSGVYPASMFIVTQNNQVL